MSHVCVYIPLLTIPLPPMVEKKKNNKVGMGKEMRPNWSADAASKAYIDTVMAVAGAGSSEEPNVAELVAALAAGSGARLIVEAWARGDGAATSAGLAIARRHTGGRHVCVVPDERAREEYAAALAGLAPGADVAAEVVVGEAEEAAGAAEGAEFVVVDCRRRGWGKVVRSVKVGENGAVVVCRGAGPRGVRWRGVVAGGVRVVRTAYMPVGMGVDIVQLAAGGGESRWIKHVDRCTGEEHVFRR